MTPVALITGANTGIGRVTALELARRGYRLLLAGLSESRTQAVIDDIAAIPGNPGAQWIPLDLADLRSVRQCAAQVLSLDLPIHALINNAGVAGSKGLTADGFERAFGINHVGHFVLTQLLLDRVIASAPARIVTVASRAHVRAKAIDWTALRQPSKSLTGITEYAVSKLANVLFSAELSRKLQGTNVSTYALHPGVVMTDVWRHVPWPLRQVVKLRKMITAEEGARTTLHCVTDPDAASMTGLYWDRSAPATPSALGQNASLARELYEWTERAVSSRSG